MRQRMERFTASLAVPLALAVNLVGMVTFPGIGMPYPATTSSDAPMRVQAPSPSPVAIRTPKPSATSTPSPTPEPQVNGYVTHTYTSPSGATMAYYLHIPSGYLPSQHYPLVLLLHGTGEAATPGATPQQNASAILGNPYLQVWSSSSIQSRWPSFVLVPQVVTPARWANGTPRKGSYTLQSQPEPALQTAMAILAAVRTQYAIDPHRIYLTGLSMGGYGAWEAAERWPSTFAAVVPISGAGAPANAADLANVPVWAFQSAYDTVVPISGSLDMLNAIKAAGGHPCFTEFSGSSHNTSTWMAVYTNKTMLAWLFAQGMPAATAASMMHCSA